jgi:hypothetical protein
MSYFSSAVLDDAINAEIWSDSVAVEGRVRAQSRPGRADLLQGRMGLPWVPDLVGPRWREPGTVMVVGSAYSPFIAESAGRRRTMPAGVYRQATDAGAFVTEFLHHVVRGDGDYYDPLGTLLNGAGVDGSHVVLTDVVRGCFIDSDGVGGDDAINADPYLYMALATAGWPWTWRRLCESQSTSIVALGTVAEHALLKLLHDQGARAVVRGYPAMTYRHSDRRVGGYARAGCDLAFWRDHRTWWEIECQVEGRPRRWCLLPVVHPSPRAIRKDPGHIVSSGILREMRAV